VSLGGYATLADREDATARIAVHEARGTLGVRDERKAKVIERKYFGGPRLTLATKLDISIGEAWQRRVLSAGVAAWPS